MRDNRPGRTKIIVVLAVLVTAGCASHGTIEQARTIAGTTCCTGLENLNAGVNADNHGNYDEAIRLYTKAIASGDLGGESLADAYALRGSAWREKKAFDRAIADYSEAIRLNPQYDFAFERRGFVYLLLANYEAAIADYSRAIGIYSSAFALYGRGLARRMMGDPTAAEADITAATKIDPTVAEKYMHYWIR